MAACSAKRASVSRRCAPTLPGDKAAEMADAWQLVAAAEAMLRREMVEKQAVKSRWIDAVEAALARALPDLRGVVRGRSPSRPKGFLQLSSGCVVRGVAARPGEAADHAIVTDTKERSLRSRAATPAAAAEWARVLRAPSAPSCRRRRASAESPSARLHCNGSGSSSGTTMARQHPCELLQNDDEGDSS